MRGIDKQQTVLLAAALLLAAGFGAFRYMPLLRQRQAMDVLMEQNNQTLEQIHIQTTRLPELIEELEEKRIQAAAFDTQIPADKSFAQLWGRFAELMNQCRLTDQLVQPGSPRESDQIGSIPLTIACSGSMQDLYAFFTAIEQWDRLIRLEEVELINDSGFNGRVKLNAKAELYYQLAHKKG